LKGSQYDPLSLYRHHFSQQLRMSRKYNGLALPEILRRKYFFIAMLQLLLCGE